MRGTPTVRSGVAERLREARLQRSMSQEDLAEAAGVSVRTIRNIELGLIARPRRSSVALIERALGLGPGELRAYVGPPHQRQPARAVAPTPRQLPPEVSDYTGRADVLRQLDALLDTGRADSNAMVLAAIVGAGGTGKTALAVRWAHRVADRFPDGQLFLDLRGFSAGGPVQPEAARGMLLHGLGVPSADVPADPGAASALYRSMLAGRRVLLVLDNAAGSEQVRSLLPGAATCVVVVTSRDPLRGLAAKDGARTLTLGPLPPAEARELLDRIVGPDRLAREPDAAAALAEACGRLPLALRVNGTNLAAAPQRTVGDLVAELTDPDRHAGRSGPGAVCTAFERAYRRLDADARRLLRQLSLVPGPTFTVPVAAAVAGWPPERARHTLDRLADAHLVDRCAPARYRFHDLIRGCAEVRCDVEENASDRRDASRRLLEHYLGHADAAARRLYPQMLRLPARPASGEPGSHGDSRAWLSAEQANLVAATVHAAGQGLHRYAYRLADALRGFLYLYRHNSDLHAIGTAALAAARAANEPHAEVAAQVILGQYHDRLGSWSFSAQCYREGLAVALEARWDRGAATCLGNLGGVYWDAGDLAQAAQCHERALRLNRNTGWRAGEAANRKNLAVLLRESGQPARAAVHLRRALALYREIGSPHGEGSALISLANVYRDLGRLGAARRYLARAQDLLRSLDSRVTLSAAMDSLALVCADAGRYAEALDHARTALTLARDDDTDRRAEIDALQTLAVTYLRTGRHQDALDHYLEALRLAGPSSARHVAATALVGCANARRGLGDLDAARRDAERALAIARANGYRAVAGDASTALAEVCLAHGRPGQALTHARAAVEAHAVTGHHLGRLRAAAVLGRCAA